MPYLWMLFDADNTLFDYDKAEARAIQRTFQELNLPFEPGMVTSYRRFNQQAWDDFENGLISLPVLRLRRFEQLFQAHNLTADPQRFSQHYLPNLAAGSDLIEGAAEILAVFSKRYRLSLITNGLKEVQINRLERSGIRPYFSAVITSEDANASKPAPAFFTAAFKAMGNPDRSQALVIGDSLTADIKGGIDYGLDTCWYNPSNKPSIPEIIPKYEIHTLEQLLTFL